jgi:hypothetical protein
MKPLEGDWVINGYIYEPVSLLKKKGPRGIPCLSAT